MKISAIEEYGVRCMIQLARHESAGSLAISDIARLEGLSVPYVAKLMSKLRRAGLVKSARGHQGGYSLCQPASEIALDHVLHALSEPIYYKGFCKDHAGGADVCVHVRDCGLRAVWREVQSAVDAVLGRVRLGDLVGGERPLRERLVAGRGGTGARPLPLDVSDGHAAGCAPHHGAAACAEVQGSGEGGAIGCAHEPIG